MTNKQFEQIECLSKKLWGDINNGHEYSMVTYTEFLGIVTEVWEKLQEEPLSEELEEAIDTYLATYFGGEKEKQEWPFLKKMAIHFAEWQKQKNSIPVSDDLEEVSKNYALNNTPWDDCKDEIQESFKAGTKWQKEHLWKSADGDDLPEYEREVVVLIQPYPLENSEYAVSFAHRPNPNGWDGKSLSTGKVEHYTPKTYDKGGWNIPDIKFWLNVELPKEIEP